MSAAIQNVSAKANQADLQVNNIIRDIQSTFHMPQTNNSNKSVDNVIRQAVCQGKK